MEGQGPRLSKAPEVSQGPVQQPSSPAALQAVSAEAAVPVPAGRHERIELTRPLADGREARQGKVS